MNDMGKNVPETVYHPIPPVYDNNSGILILGSFPSVRSRQSGFFYGHPQNRFWRTLAAIYGDATPGVSTPCDITQKIRFLLSHRIALWDVIASCEISGSSDGSIRNAVPNNLDIILKHSQVRRIFVNGHTAERLYRRFQYPLTGIEAVCLPSSSPANAAWSDCRLLEEWRRLLTG